MDNFNKELGKVLLTYLRNVKAEIEKDGLVGTLDEAISRAEQVFENHDCKDEKCDNSIHEQI